MCGKSHHIWHHHGMSSDPIHEAPLVSKPIVMELDVEAVSAVAVNALTLWIPVAWEVMGITHCKHVCITMDRYYHIFPIEKINITWNNINLDIRIGDKTEHVKICRNNYDTGTFVMERFSGNMSQWTHRGRQLRRSNLTPVRLSTNHQ